VLTLAETDWSEAWKAHYLPLRVGQHLLVTPSWLSPEVAPEDVVIELDPGMAFGSGLHPSTRLCLLLLEQYLRPGDAVLDLGTGSGILAIGAAKLGAGPIVARDTDPIAVSVAQENVRANGVGHLVRVEQGSLPSSGTGTEVKGAGYELQQAGPWNLILVNILADVIIGLLDRGLAARLSSGGRLILSGVIGSRASDVEGALRANELVLTERLQEGDWMAYVAEGPNDAGYRVSGP
jgi:ribosomal protein L11 methyltransferase